MSVHKLSTKEILQRNLSRSVPDRMKKVSLLLHNVRSMHNVGAVFRCADAFGVQKIVLSGFTPVPPRPEITKTAIGAEKYVDWEEVPDPVEHLRSLKKHETEIIGLEQTDNSRLLPDFEPSPVKRICLVFGNEVTGIDENILGEIDHFVEIPQYGHKHSLNVSVSAGVALYAFLVKFWQVGVP